MLNALNEVLRDDFIKDSVAGVGRWNKVLEKAGIAQRLTVPHKAFNRKIGALAGIKHVARRPRGQRRGVEGEGERVAAERGDLAFVASLMGRVVEPGKFAGWIAPPAMGINKPAGRFRVRPIRLMIRGDGNGHGRPTRGHQAAPDRPRDLHPLQHLRGDLPGRRDHARRPQLRRPRRRLQLLHGVHLAVPHRLDRQLAHGAEGARLCDRGAAHLGRAAARAHARAAGGRRRRRPRPRQRRPPSRCSRSSPKPRPAKRRSTAPRTARPCRRGRRRTPTPTCSGRRARPPRPSSATSTAPRRASTTRRTTSCSTSARCPFPVLEGQSIGIVPPGVDAHGRPHVARQYSIASPRNGERPGYNNVSLTVKRVTEDHQGRPVARRRVELRVRPQGRRHGAGDRPVRPELPDAEPPEVAHRHDLHRHRQRADAGDDRMAPAPAQERQVRGRQADAVLRRAHARGAAVLRPAADRCRRTSSTSTSRSRARRGSRSATCRT